jgi:glycerate dehydrogenase
MKIVILDGHALNPGDLSWDCIRQFGDVTIYDRTPGKAETIRRIGDAQIVLLNKVPIDVEILSACPSVKLICCLSTGYNVVDICAARERSIPVCNVPAYSTAAVSQFTFALLLELCHRIGHHDQTVHNGKWSSCPNFCYWDTPQMELAGKTMGIIGYGRIGQAVGKIARAMGMKVLANSRTVRDDVNVNYVDIDTLLTQSDVISLHCPLFPETENLINTETIAKMKDGAILLNTSRGQVIDEAAVADALRSGKLRGAAMDVVSEEPISPTNPLLSAPNCIITPHMAWAPVETRQRILDTTVQSIRGYLSGTPVNVVNP